MEGELYQKLSSVLCNYSTINRFLGGDFLHKQCLSGLKSYILKRLAQAETNENLQHLDFWNTRLARLNCVPGFDKLSKGLRSPNSEQYYETLTQIDTSIWFSQRHLLKEIEPELPRGRGSCDLLVSLKRSYIYCEVSSRRFPEVNSRISVEKIQRVQKGQPWLKEQDLIYKQEIYSALQSLRSKAKRQLPPNSPGILVFETGRAAFFRSQTRGLADKLFAGKSQTPITQVILIMLWSLEGGSGIGQPPFWFLNRNSRFRMVGQRLIEHLGEECKTVECG